MRTYFHQVISTTVILGMLAAVLLLTPSIGMAQHPRHPGKTPHYQYYYPKRMPAPRHPAPPPHRPVYHPLPPAHPPVIVYPPYYQPVPLPVPRYYYPPLPTREFYINGSHGGFSLFFGF